MLNTIAANLTEQLYARCPLDPKKKAIYTYGFQLGLSTLASMSSIFIFAIAFRNVYSAFAFLGVFFILRLFSGGYHASTYARCFVLTNGVFLGVYVSSIAIEYLQFQTLLPFLTVISCTVVVLLAPIKNRNHPMSESTFKRNQRIARALVLSEGIAFLILYYTQVFIPYLITPILSLTAVAVMMIIPYWERRKNW